QRRTTLTRCVQARISYGVLSHIGIFGAGCPPNDETIQFGLKYAFWNPWVNKIPEKWRRFMKRRNTNADFGGADRRDFLKLPMAAGLVGALATPRMARGAPKIDEHDPANTKIATMVNARASDDQFLFLKQIGIRWVHVQFPIDANFDLVKTTQDRLA